MFETIKSRKLIRNFLTVGRETIIKRRYFVSLLLFCFSVKSLKLDIRLPNIQYVVLKFMLGWVHSILSRSHTEVPSV